MRHRGRAASRAPCPPGPRSREPPRCLPAQHRVEVAREQLPRRVPDHAGQRVVDLEEPSAEIGEGHPDGVVLERPAEPLLALRERAVEPVVLERDGGEVGEARDEPALALVGAVGCGVVDRERAEHAVVAPDGARPAGPQPVGQRQGPEPVPADVAGDVLGDHRLVPVRRRAARPGVGPDRHPVDRGGVGGGQGRRGPVVQGPVGRVEHEHRAAAARDQLLERERRRPRAPRRARRRPRAARARGAAARAVRRLSAGSRCSRGCGRAVTGRAGSRRRARCGCAGGPPGRGRACDAAGGRAR